MITKPPLNTTHIERMGKTNRVNLQEYNNNDKDTTVENEDCQTNEKDKNTVEKEDCQVNDTDKNMVEKEDCQTNDKDTTVEKEDCQVNDKDTTVEKEDCQVNDKDTTVEKEDCRTNTCTKDEFYKSFEESQFARTNIFGKFPIKNKASELVELLQGIKKGNGSFEKGDDRNEKWDPYILKAIQDKFVITENGVLGGRKQKQILPYILYEDLYDTFCKWDVECKSMGEYYGKTNTFANVNRKMIKWYIDEFRKGKIKIFSRNRKRDPSKWQYVNKTNYEGRISPQFLKFLNTYTATVKLSEPNISREI